MIPDNKFANASAESVTECLRKIHRKKKKARSLDSRAKAMREEEQKACQSFSANGRPDELRESYKERVQDLYRAYAVKEQEKVLNKVTKAENDHQSMIHRKACKLINHSSGRKNVQSSIIKANSSEERVQLWHTHFSKLFGSLPPPLFISNPEFPIESVFYNLEISEISFSSAEYDKAKKSMLFCKASGEGGITQSFLNMLDWVKIYLVS